MKKVPTSYFDEWHFTRAPDGPQDWIAKVQKRAAADVLSVIQERHQIFIDESGVELFLFGLDDSDDGVNMLKINVRKAIRDACATSEANRERAITLWSEILALLKDDDD